MNRAVWALILLLAATPALAVPDPAPVQVRKIVTFAAPTTDFGDLLLLHEYSSFPGALLEGPVQALDALARRADVLGVYDNDPLETHLDLSRAVLGLEGTGAPTTGGAGVAIALVDAGIDPNHPAYRGRVETYAVTGGQVAPTTQMQGTTGHGTEVLGILASDGAQSPGNRYRGLVPQADIVTLDLGADFTTDTALRAFDWIHENHEAKGIRIVTNSWGRTGNVDGKFDPAAPLVLASDTLAIEDGLLVVFSAGNRGTASSIAPEALNPNVLTVGATDAGGILGDFSSRGPGLDAAGAPLAWTKPDLVAIGDGVVTTRALAGVGNAAAGGRSLAPAFYGEVSGTSFAAPMVAATAALILAENPDLDRVQLTRAMTVSARDLGAPGKDVESGAGLLDARLAIDLAARGAIPAGAVARQVGSEFPDFNVVSTAGISLRIGATPSTDPAADIVGYIPVLPGSPLLRAEATWTSTAPSAFTVRLVKPDGSAGPALSGTGSKLSATVASPVPGVWTIRATPSGSVQQASLTLAGESTADRDVGALLLGEEVVSPAATTGGASSNALFGGIAIAILAVAVIVGGAVLVGKRVSKR